MSRNPKFEMKMDTQSVYRKLKADMINGLNEDLSNPTISEKYKIAATRTAIREIHDFNRELGLPKEDGVDKAWLTRIEN